MKFAANLTYLWADLPFLDRFEAARLAGFRAVEVQYPYDVPAREIQNALRRHGLKLILINAPPPNYTGGERGYAAIPGRTERFQHDMRRAFRYAEALCVPFMHVVSGNAQGDEAFDTYVKNLKWAARAAPKGLTLTIEPLNTVDFPNYFLDSYDLAARVLDAVKKPNVRLQFDAYHAQMIHGDAVEIWHRFGLRAAHVQFADSPGRVEPGLGEINFKALFSAIADQGYDGWVAAEYKCKANETDAGLDWFNKSRAGRVA